MPDTLLDLFAPPRIVAERRDDGAVLLRSEEALGPYPPSMAHAFRANADAHPDRVLAARRDGEGWRTLTWGEARLRADAIAQALLDHGLGPARPLMVLSGNSIEHLLMMLGAFTAGVPILPLSTAYSLLSTDHERIRAIAELCAPRMVFADDAAAYGRALDALSATVELEVVASGERPAAMRLDDLIATPATAAVERAYDALGPETVAKILFTSGSTGAPKGVVNTHRMLCSNQRALGQVWPFLRSEPPVLVDWLPWSHTFGGNHNANQVLAFGGTLHIDDGKPTPELFERSIAALREVRPTVYYNVPAGYALLAPRLEEDRDFAEAFFSRLRFMFYAAAALPEALWHRLRAVSREVADHEVPLTAAWGTTETAPGATTAHFASAPCGCIGVPLPGVTLKLVPTGAKREIRLRGQNVTPGYHADPRATAAAFDDEGYYRTGDAVTFVDDDDPNLGLMFDGRLAEDFKLVTGTWVTVGRVRTSLVSAAAVLSDAVIAGHDGAYVAALAWVDRAEAARVCDVDGDVALDHPALRAHLARRLTEMNASAGSAGRVERLLLLEEAPDMDAGEITDKGYVNQRAVLERRAELVARLLSDPADDAVIVPG
ncbi:MAG: feruloyl-CoA synthase [Solirubrobacteraceae bacterium]|jgi:feruloyl-CoA synthase|nr:feruloyl-CoA synthase [Solirubrobacteraceae bacterium]